MKDFAKVLKNPSAQLVLAAGVTLIAVYWFVIRPTGKAVVDTAIATGGIVRDAVTGELVDADSPYYGAGVVGTVGAATNAVSGGLLARFGSFLGRTAADAVDAVTGRGDPNR